MAYNDHIYSDLDLTFNKVPGTKDVAMKYDEQAVIRSIRNLLSTNLYERLFQPTILSNLEGLLFDNISPLMETTIAKEIQNIIENYEPRVSLEKINEFYR